IFSAQNLGLLVNFQRAATVTYHPVPKAAAAGGSAPMSGNVSLRRPPPLFFSLRKYLPTPG
ncbi:MAG: hypothetical protein ACREUQ_08945, partial [Burkholderiales bacterium]